MNLVSHLSQSLKERYGLSGEEAYRLARSIEDSDAWECAGGSCELSEEGLAGSLEERLTDRSMDTMPMARFMASELRSYVSLFKMHDGKFNSALAKRIQEHYSDYGVSRMDSYVLAAAFAASSAGHDFQSDLNNFKHIERSMEHSVETYLKNSEGPFPGLDMNDVAGFVFEQVWGTKPDEDGRKLAMSDGPSISAAPNYSPEDYITVDVRITNPSPWTV